jgi:hypothetical protein
MFCDDDFHLVGLCPILTRRTSKPVRIFAERFDIFIYFVSQSKYAKKSHFFPAFTICSKMCR